MHHSRILLSILTFTTLATGFARAEVLVPDNQKNPALAQANCTVKMVKEASSIEMTLATSKADCTEFAAQPGVQATYSQGTIERRLRGAGPQQ
jgi:hypothetical protein